AVRIKTQGNRGSRTWWGPGQTGMVHAVGHDLGNDDADGCADRTEHASLDQKLLPDALPPDPHSARRADFARALDDAPPHGVADGEEHDDADDQRDEREDRSEQTDDLVVLRIEVGEVPHFEIEPTLLEQ